MNITTIFLIILGSTLGLVLSDGSTRTANLLALVLGLFHGLAAPVLLLLQSKSDETMLGFKLHQSILVVVNDAKARGLSTSKLGAEAKQHNQLRVSLVHASDHVLQFRFGYVGTARMDDVNNHLCVVRKYIDEDNGEVDDNLHATPPRVTADAVGFGLRHTITYLSPRKKRIAHKFARLYDDTLITHTCKLL